MIIRMPIILELEYVGAISYLNIVLIIILTLGV